MILEHRTMCVIGILIAGTAVATLQACSDSGGSSPSGGVSPLDSGTGYDASVPADDASTIIDSSTGTDAGTVDAADATPPPITFSLEVGPAGKVLVAPSAVVAGFKVDQGILHSSALPSCVGYYGSTQATDTSAGTLTVGGTAVGQDGGLATPLIVPFNEAYFKPAPDGQVLFRPARADSVQVQVEGTPFVPALPPTAVRSPAVTPVQVTSPTRPDGGAGISISTSAAFDIAWKVPAGDLGEQQLIVSFLDLTDAKSARVMNFSCGFPLAAGSAKIPQEVLSDIKSRLGSPLTGSIEFHSGGFKEVRQGGASYKLEVHGDGTTNFVDSVPLNLN
jgi:hypothetical protein